MSDFENQSGSGPDWRLMKKRAAILRYIREYFFKREFLEVESPLLTPFPSLDSNISSFITAWYDGQGHRSPLFLHTSPEHAMKKMLAAGAGNIVFLGKVFRNEESSILHNAEFTMLEWYRRQADYRDIMNDTEELICFLCRTITASDSLMYQGTQIDMSPPWKRITVRELFLQYVGIDLSEKGGLHDLRNAAAAHDIHFLAEDDWQTMFFRLFLSKIEPFLGMRKPVFVTDYPLSMGLMAKSAGQDSPWAERAELYLGGLEIANGYSELLDPAEQEARFMHEQQEKTERTGRTLPVDRELIEALKQPLPPCAGMALGVDRLIMLLTDRKNIADVLLFPLSGCSNKP